LPALDKSRFARLFQNVKALDVESSLDVDERKVKLTLFGDRAPSPLRLPLALPAPWSGTVDIVPRAVEGRWCAPVNATLFDQDLREAAVDGMPVDVSVTVQKKGQPAKTTTIQQDGLVFAPDALVAKAGDSDKLRLYVGDGPPSDDVLAVDGADLYMKSLAALEPAIVDDIRTHPSVEAQRVLFAESAASLRSSLPSWRPEKRLAEVARFDENSMPVELKPLLHFWRTEFSVRKTWPKDAPKAHVIVDDAVQSLWLDGVSVFDRAKGTPTGFDVRVPHEAVRAWIVTSDQVHDTRAVLKGGEIYSVTPTFVQPVKGGVRRECVRVVGKLPQGKVIRWREIAGTQTPMLGDDETYRPSGASAERAFSVVPGGDARPFPPVPLVYSYTHAGLYKWTLAGDGSLELDVVDDQAVCAPRP
jgi:hypothetical protein